MMEKGAKNTCLVHNEQHKEHRQDERALTGQVLRDGNARPKDARRLGAGAHGLPGQRRIVALTRNLPDNGFHRLLLSHRGERREPGAWEGRF